MSYNGLLIQHMSHQLLHPVFEVMAGTSLHTELQTAAPSSSINICTDIHEAEVNV